MGQKSKVPSNRESNARLCGLRALNQAHNNTKKKHSFRMAAKRSLKYAIGQWVRAMYGSNAFDSQVVDYVAKHEIYMLRAHTETVLFQAQEKDIVKVTECPLI